MAQVETLLKDVKVLGEINDVQSKILTKEACAFLATLHRTFNQTRKDLLRRREIRQAEIDKGVLPDFLPETKHIRDDPTWRGADPAPGLVDRRVEITGPTDRKMVVNALNADVWTYMADFEGLSSYSDCGIYIILTLMNRFQCSFMGEHDQWSGQPLRCYPSPSGFQAQRQGLQAPHRPPFTNFDCSVSFGEYCKNRPD